MKRVGPRMATAILIMRGYVHYIADGSPVSMMLKERKNNGAMVVPVPAHVPLRSLTDHPTHGDQIEVDKLNRI